MATMLGDSKDTVPKVPDIPNVPDSTTFLNQPPNFSEYRAEGDCPEDRVAAAMLGNANPLLGGGNVPLAGSQGEAGQSGSGPPHLAARESHTDFVESPMESPSKGRPEGPPENPLKGPLLSTTAAPQRHPPRMAQLVEEALWRQPRVVLTHLPLLPGVVSRRVLPRSGKVGGKKAKHPTPAGMPNTQEPSLRDSIPPKNRKKMVVCQVVKHSKTLYEGKPDGDSTAAGSSRQQARSSKRRASNGNSGPPSMQEP